MIVILQKELAQGIADAWKSVEAKLDANP